MTATMFDAIPLAAVRLSAEINALHDLVGLQETMVLRTHMASIVGEELRAWDRAAADARSGGAVFRGALERVMRRPSYEWRRIAARFTTDGERVGMAFVEERLEGDDCRYARTGASPGVVGHAFAAASRWRALVRALPSEDDVERKESVHHALCDQVAQVLADIRDHPLTEKLLGPVAERTEGGADPLPAEVLEHAESLSIWLDRLLPAERQAVVDAAPPTTLARLYHARQVLLAMDERLGR